MDSNFMTHSYPARKYNNFISISIIGILLATFLCCFYLNVVFDLTDYEWSSLFIVVILVIYFLRFFSRENIISFYSLFFLTSLLFIGGRFLSIFLGYKGQPLYELDFFVYDLLDNQRSSKLFFIVISGFLALEFGHYLSKLVFKRNHDSIDDPRLMLDLNKYVMFGLIALIFSILLVSSYQTFLLVVNEGYLALYSSQGEKYGVDYNSILRTVLSGMTGIFLSQKSKSNRTIFLVLLGLNLLLFIIAGARGGFVSFLLFLAWYIHDCGLKKVNLFKFSLYVAGVFVFITFIFGMISLRETDVTQESAYQKIVSILYDQGVTLMVFNESLYVDHYPVLPLVQNFIPGSSFVYSRLVGDVFPYDISFAAYLSHSLNPELYDAGFGVGWAFFGDAYLYGFRTPLLFCFFVAAFSVFLNYLQINITKNIYIKIITISLVPTVMFLPRSSLNTVFPLIPYILIFFFLIKFLAGSHKNENTLRNNGHGHGRCRKSCR